ncbi:MAG: hypothetical protein KRP56_01395 [Candidatus Methanogranum gryphiswaldense]|nr:MAG: hypothetical protein KRP56_01395 [Candidatus Methanogranum sp. U3.2.1]
MPDEPGGGKNCKCQTSRSSAGVSDGIPKVPIIYVKESKDSYTALMWINYPSITEINEGESQKAIQSRFIEIVGRDYEQTAKRQKVYLLSTKRKAIVVILVLLLSCIPLIPVLLPTYTVDTTVVTMSDPDITGSTYAEGKILIEQVEDDDVVEYDISFTGVAQSCTWYLFCNEDTVYKVQGNSYVKRDYTKIGTGQSITISDSVMHIGSYQIKLVTEADVFTDTVVIDGNIDTTYSWKFVGVGGSSVLNSIDIPYRFMDYYDYYEESDISRVAYNRVSDFAVVGTVIEDLVEKLNNEYTNHYGIVDSDWYANYLLAFVQECFDYPSWSEYPDLYIYGQYEYYAYPMETLFRGIGDCEDTAILCSTLFDYAGYDAAVVLLYTESSEGKTVGHSTSAVSLVKLVTSYNVNDSSFSYSEMTYNDVKYYLCETATSDQLAAGYIQSMYLDASKLIFPVTIND